MTTPAPRLFWAARPQHKQCAGCGREPLCGFRDAEGETFLCAVCWDDGLTDPTDAAYRVVAPSARRPRFRTPEKRKRILKGRA